jgi:hypothetical protein
MCKSGNQTTNHECWMAILALVRQTTVTNQEKRRILREHDGCMMPKVDKVKVPVLQ